MAHKNDHTQQNFTQIKMLITYSLPGLGAGKFKLAVSNCFLPPEGNSSWQFKTPQPVKRHLYTQTLLLTCLLSLTARIVLEQLQLQISVPFLKWQTFSLRGALRLTMATKLLENSLSTMHTSSVSAIVTKGKQKKEIPCQRKSSLLTTQKTESQCNKKQAQSSFVNTTLHSEF